MNRAMIYVTNQDALDKVWELIVMDGYVMDPEWKVIRFDQGVIYHLVKYTEEEQLQLIEEEEARKPGALEDVIEVMDVESDHVNEMYQQGFRVYEIYSKSVKMIKRAEAENHE